MSKDCAGAGCQQVEMAMLQQHGLQSKGACLRQYCLLRSFSKANQWQNAQWLLNLHAHVLHAGLLVRKLEFTGVRFGRLEGSQ